MIKRYRNSAERRKIRTRARIGKGGRVRLVVFKSNKYLYAQLVDNLGKTLTGIRGGKAEEVGKAISQKAKALKISEAVFDRGSYKYHGQVKSLADAAREGGLKL